MNAVIGIFIVSVFYLRFYCRLLTLVEQGLISHWMEDVPNITECENVPKKMLVTSYISLSNIWVSE